MTPLGSRLADAVRALRGRPAALPFVSEPVSSSAALARAVDAAFGGPLESLAVDGLVVDLAAGLMAAERGGVRADISRRVDVPAVEHGGSWTPSGRASCTRGSSSRSPG